MTFDEKIEYENRKNYVLIKYLKSIIKGFQITAEFNVDEDNVSVIVVQEKSGQKIVMWNDNPLFNYFSIDIFGVSIQEMKNTSNIIGRLIGKSILIDLPKKDDETTIERWQIIFKQYSNPQTLEYKDIRRVSYNSTLCVIIGKVYEYKKEGK